MEKHYQTFKMEKNPEWRALKPTPPPQKFCENFEEGPLIVFIATWLNYLAMTVSGIFRDTLRALHIEKYPWKLEPYSNDWVPLYPKGIGRSSHVFFTRNMYRVIRDVFNRPISSTPGATVDVMRRTTPDNGWTFNLSRKSQTVMNLGSYNYLGFAQSTGPCADYVDSVLPKLGCSLSSTRHELGNTRIIQEMEQVVSRFLGTEDCMTFGMGFATNSMNIPVFAQRGSLILSDSMNHASIVLGSRLSGATIKTFKHNDMEDLESLLKTAIVRGQSMAKGHPARPWKKILIICEGIYSMEGSIVRLPELIALKKKYKAYLYLDEAHSVGALGPHGRGIIDYWGCNPKDVDVQMGTFTKSFGGVGGYIAGSKELIRHVRISSHSACYANSMPSAVAAQIIAAVNMIAKTDEGQLRLDQLAWNCRYFRRRLHEMGFIVFGNQDSPVVPVLMYLPAKVAIFSRECLRRGLAVVVVGYPATPINSARARFCLSASHNKQFLDKALQIISDVGDILHLKQSNLPVPNFSENDDHFLLRYPTLAKNCAANNSISAPEYECDEGSSPYI